MDQALLLREGLILLAVGMLVGIHRRCTPEEIPELALCKNRSYAIRL
jgi:hypothetical protein